MMPGAIHQCICGERFFTAAGLAKHILRPPIWAKGKAHGAVAETPKVEKIDE